MTAPLEDVLEWVSIKTPYNPEYLQEFKATIPWRCREWNPDHKVWLIDKRYLGRVKRLAKKHNLNMVGVTEHNDPWPGLDTSNLDDLKGIPVSLAMRLIEVKDAKERTASNKAKEEDSE